MLNDSEEYSPVRMRARLRNGEVTMCILAVVLAIGMFSVSNTEGEGSFVVACDSIFVCMSMPPAASVGQFNESVCRNSPHESPLHFTTKDSVSHQPKVVLSLSSNMTP